MQDIFTIDFPEIEVLHFRYLQLHLIKKNWRNFIESNNPVAAALLSKMGYTEDERIQVRLEFLRMVSRMELNSAKMKLLYGFFDTYLKLNDKEEKQMREKISHLPKEEADRVLELPNYYFDKGVEKGVEKGIEKIIHNMLKQGFSDETIEKATGLSLKEVNKIKEKRNGDG